MKPTAEYQAKLSMTTLVNSCSSVPHFSVVVFVIIIITFQGSIFGWSKPEETIKSDLCFHIPWYKLRKIIRGSSLHSEQPGPSVCSFSPPPSLSGYQNSQTIPVRLDPDISTAHSSRWRPPEEIPDQRLQASPLPELSNSMTASQNSH